jgi:hypothetical protein
VDLNFEAIRNEFEDIGRARNNTMFQRARLKPGTTNKWRIMPAYNDKGDFFHKVNMHWRVGGPQGKTFPCQGNFGGECYMCKVVQQMRTSGQDRLAQQWAGRPQYLINVWVLDNQEEYNKGIVIGSLSRPPMQQLLGFLQDNSQAALKKFLDPVEGRAVFITVKGTGFDTEYQVVPDMELFPIQNWQEVRAKLHKLDQVMKPSTPEAMAAAVQAALSGGVAAVPAPTTFNPGGAAPAFVAPPMVARPPQITGPIVPSVPAPLNIPPTIPTVAGPIPPTPASTGGIPPEDKTKMDNFLNAFEKKG